MKTLAVMIAILVVSLVISSAIVKLVDERGKPSAEAAVESEKNPTLDLADDGKVMTIFDVQWGETKVRLGIIDQREAYPAHGRGTLILREERAPWGRGWAVYCLRGVTHRRVPQGVPPIAVFTGGQGDIISFSGCLGERLEITVRGQAVVDEGLEGMR